MKKLIFVSLLLFPLLVSAETFEHDLYFGMTGNPDVIKLQEFLASEGLFDHEPTGNFYSLTSNAVKAFQTREGISPVSGFFGPLTRTKANQLSAKQPSVQPSPVQPTATTCEPVVKEKIVYMESFDQQLAITKCENLRKEEAESYYQDRWDLYVCQATTTALVASYRGLLAEFDKLIDLTRQLNRDYLFNTALAQQLDGYSDFASTSRGFIQKFK